MVFSNDLVSKPSMRLLSRTDSLYSCCQNYLFLWIRKISFIRAYAIDSIESDLCVAAAQVVEDGAQIAPGMAEALLQRRLRVGASPAVANRAVLLCEALQAGSAAFQLADIPGPPSGMPNPEACVHYS